MKAKKQVALPRRNWQINPVTRVKRSARVFSRPKARQEVRRETAVPPSRGRD